MNRVSKYQQQQKINYDNWANPKSGWGSNKSPMARTQFIPNTIIDRSLAESLYQFNWLARNIIEIIPEEATREWIKIVIDDPKINEQLLMRMEEFDIQQLFEEGFVLSRLYGGSIIVLGVDDGLNIEEPLNEDNIKSINFFTVLDRHQVEVESLFKDPLSKDFGKPEMYRLVPIESIQNDIKIHSSRVLRFDGLFLPDFTKKLNRGWCDSVFNNINDSLKQYGVAFQGAADLFQEFLLKILKMPNLGEMVADETGREELALRLQVILTQFSNNGLVAIGDTEELEKKTTNTTGLPQLLDKFIEAISAASKIPRARLFGQQLGKLSGATETTKAFFAFIHSQQRKHLRKPLEKLIRLFFKEKGSITGGKEPQEWSMKFNPLEVEELEQTLKNRKTQSESDKNWIESGVLLPEEVSESRFGGNEFSFETKLDTTTRREFAEAEKELNEEEENENIQDSIKNDAVSHSHNVNLSGNLISTDAQIGQGPNHVHTFNIDIEGIFSGFIVSGKSVELSGDHFHTLSINGEMFSTGPINTGVRSDGRELQTIIISKEISSNIEEATKIARKFGKITKTETTKSSFRFRQKNPGKFVKGSFKTFNPPKQKGVSLVFGELKNG
jgi:phage-related protein (TIGR01555 family)